MQDVGHDFAGAGETDEVAHVAAPPAETPRDFRTLRALILERRDGLPKRLIQVAEFALQHPSEIAFGRVAELARQAGYSPRR